MKQLDMSSDEFLKELEKTKKFTDKVCKNFGWEYHPMHDVNEGVQYIDCFMENGFVHVLW